MGEKTKLRDACEYALTNGGKRFRPLIVLLVAEALEMGLNVVEAALSVEYFHTASLIADDLPCMDNDDERREMPSLHKVYGESIALLASYALITAAFEKIHRNALVMRESGAPFAQASDRACMLALESATHCSGILGATGGQFHDLFPPNHNLETVKQVIYQKTVTLFEVSFIFGWVFGGGDVSKLDLVKKAAYHFGMAFQTADDLGDMLQDEKKQREISIARLIGKERALAFFEEEMRHLNKLLEELKLLTPSFEKMCNTLVKYAHNNICAVV
ncbi:MAG: polyprenyl synthetase family protein [Rhabdochlamydiaceae bacterium]|nr:polyprenyl synthetase family protein [Rhabdochlamydiaceae bacterium]